MPRHYLEDEKKLERIIKLTFFAWNLTDQLVQGHPELQDTVMKMIWDEDEGVFKELPELRMFVEGWRLDEVQLLFSRLTKHRSISIAYVGGKHCLAGYPLLDCTTPELYERSLACLISLLEILGNRTCDRPLEMLTDPREYDRMSKACKDAERWQISSEDVAVMRYERVSKDNQLGISMCRDWARV